MLVLRASLERFAARFGVRCLPSEMWVGRTWYTFELASAVPVIKKLY